jgi:hypothetical protein
MQWATINVKKVFNFLRRLHCQFSKSFSRRFLPALAGNIDFCGCSDRYELSVQCSIVHECINKLRSGPFINN